MENYCKILQHICIVINYSETVTFSGVYGICLTFICVKEQEQYTTSIYFKANHNKL